MGVVAASRPLEKSASLSGTIWKFITILLDRFFTFTLERSWTESADSLLSSITRALATFSFRRAIFTSSRPWASRAASYSAFSERSPFSRASAMAAEITGRWASASASSCLILSRPAWVIISIAIDITFLVLSKKQPTTGKAVELYVTTKIGIIFCFSTPARILSAHQRLWGCLPVSIPGVVDGRQYFFHRRNY